jgi:hypothetical protein
MGGWKDNLDRAKSLLARSRRNQLGKLNLRKFLNKDWWPSEEIEKLF